MPRITGWLASQLHRNNADRTAAKARGYQPKFCRARGCGRPFGHDGEHEGRDRPALGVSTRQGTASPQRRAERVQRANRNRTGQPQRQVGVRRQQFGPLGSSYQPRRSPKAGPVLPVNRAREQRGSRTPGFIEVREGGVRERMARYRAHQPQRRTVR